MSMMHNTCRQTTGKLFVQNQKVQRQEQHRVSGGGIGVYVGELVYKGEVLGGGGILLAQPARDTTVRTIWGT